MPQGDQALPGTACLCCSLLCHGPGHADKTLPSFLNLTLANLGKTLHFPRVLHISCWAGCPPMSSHQLNHAASAVPRGPCPCPSALSLLVCSHGTSLTSTTLAQMEPTCASLHIPHMLLTFLATATALRACVTPMGCCAGPWSPPTLGEVGTNPERHRESWTCTRRTALCLSTSGHLCIRCIMLLFEASDTSLVKTAPLCLNQVQEPALSAKHQMKHCHRPLISSYP